MPDLDQIKQGEQGARDRRGRFARGRSGNPAGRPPGIGCQRKGEVIQLVQEVSLQICCRSSAGQSGAQLLVAVRRLRQSVFGQCS
jgi:hypothetical protein